MHVLAICDTKSLLSCARTCKYFQVVVAAEMRMRSIALLEVFVGDRVRHFNGLLRLHDAVVSGSLALALFLWPTDWMPGDMDIYIGDTSYLAFVADFERCFPVTLDADFTSRGRPTYTGIKGVRRYLTATGQRFDLIRSKDASAVAPLLYFWSSAMVNFITPRGAVCGYPSLTLSAQGLVEAVTPNKKVLAARSKYEKRGVRFTDVDDWRPSSRSVPDGHRIFVEKALLVVDFRTVWSTGRTSLPINRERFGWVLNSKAHHPASRKTTDALDRDGVRCLISFPF